jgi:deazaflavin-dependent oxidoreductase (nitroreductase family)
LKQISEFSIHWVKFFITKIRPVKFKEGAMNVILVTTGRKSGKEHAVELKAVCHNGKIYFSRRNPKSDWLKNAIANPLVKVRLGDETLRGKASLVTDEELATKISRLKYSDKRAEDSRIVLEITLNE